MAATRKCRVRFRRSVLLPCALLFIGIGIGFVGASTAQADLLEPVAVPVEEAVTSVGQAAPPVAEVAAPVTTPAQEAAGGATAAVAKVPQPVRPPSAGEPSPAAETAAATTAIPTVQAAQESLKGVKDNVEGTVERSLPSTEIAVPAPPAASAPGSSTAAPSEANDAASAATTSPTRSSSSGRLPNSYVPPPAKTGATGAPLPRWMAYVWPAVALTGPYLLNIAEHWRQAALRLVAATADDSGAVQGVAGVHASGGASATSDSSSSSLLQRLPSAVGHRFSSVSTPALIYLGLLVLAVIAVALAVRREVSAGRHW